MADTIHILGEGGGIFTMALPLHETIADKLAKGHVRRVRADGSPYVEDERPDGVPSLPTSRPPVGAPKSEWIGWAVHEGMTADDAEALTKQDLIEKFGAAHAKSDEEIAAEAAAKAEEEAAEKAAAEAAALAAGTPAATA